MNVPSSLRAYLRRFGSRETVGADTRAGITLGVERVPDGLAAGVLAGVNPIFGLNAHLMGSIAGALTTGSILMTVQATGAMAVIIDDVPALHGVNAGGAIAMLTVLTGLIMLGLGLARMGSLVRFIPSAVLIGFMNAVAINIVLGQLDNLTGFSGDGPNRVTRAFDTVLGLPHYSWASVLVGAVTIALILSLERTRLGALALVVAVVAGSLIALPFSGVATLGDIADITRSLPDIVAPDLSSTFTVLIPAVSIALVGLVQGAAISGSIPNPDGRYPDASADFRGQGIANLAAGVAQGMPVGGSTSGTALTQAAGAKTALANVIAAAVMVVTVLLAGPLIESLAMPALAGLLILVGARTFKLHQLVMVWRSGRTQVAVFAVTFALTLVIPLQYAVITGVGLSVILQIARQSNRVRIVRWVFDEADGRPLETPPPATLLPGETVVLAPYGSLFFASAQAFREQLPTPAGPVPGAHVIIRLRGNEELGITFLTMVRIYAEELAEHGGTLILAGVDPQLDRQLQATGVAELLGPDNVFPVRRRLGDSVAEALDAIARRRSGPEP